MSVSDPGKKIEWGADSEHRKNERVPSSDFHVLVFSSGKALSWLSERLDYAELELR